MTRPNLQWLLASRPGGEPTPANFRLATSSVPALKDGEVLVRHHYLSLDPYMRGRMNDGKNYAAPQPLDAVMIGGTVGEVIESQHDAFRVGDTVVGAGGWQQYSIVNVSQPGLLRRRRRAAWRCPRRRRRYHRNRARPMRAMTKKMTA